MTCEDESAAVGRDIKFKKTVAADGDVIDCYEFFDGSERLVDAIEPPVVGLECGVTNRGAEIWAGSIATVVGDPTAIC